ncbi:hypothetical protein KSP40_PGU008163 [Platanthera guangdongensis]|uniref:Uncharacterized protein n=1 Tax=Platanthera guangdongensis TaxID=2320717 RepID=A0ABR2LPL0_9ASPA
MDSKHGDEVFDVFYTEIEERIMLLISDEEDGDVMMAERLSHRGCQEKQLLQKPFLINASRYCSFGQAAKQRRGYCGIGMGRNTAWAQSEWQGGVRRSPPASGRSGTGVFIPRCAA